ncbi:Ger(x)C family spore germination protein [Bacillus sp. FJAT-45037]|uniref:Ger(x)C family spore germination protein n=1 Tax=Bacillus sp. FJAT-45037 TaxID=2011007 RepID=UPI000C239C2A|nr:Ger(x)C family spore germination protein [Bacillus sp. FJAT-45037]
MKVMISLLCILCLLTGCLQTSILDEIQLVHAVGYDYFDEERIEATVNVPVYNLGDIIESETISAVSKTSKDARLALNAQASKPLHSGKITTILFNEEVAQKTGLMSVLDTFSREPTIGMRNYIVITQGSSKELLNSTYPLEMEVATYLEKLIEQNIELQNMPSTNFHLFLKYFYEEGRDPFLPYIRQEKNHVKVDGVALFKEDRYVDRIDLTDTFIMKILLEPTSNGTYEVELGGQNEFAVLRNIHSKTKYKIEHGTNTPKIDVFVEFKGKINEYSGQIIDPPKLEEIKGTLTRQIQTDSDRLIKLFQERNIDPIGIGSRVRGKNYQFKLAEWEDYYPNAQINVEVKVEITETGVRQ